METLILSFFVSLYLSFSLPLPIYLSFSHVHLPTHISINPNVRQSELSLQLLTSLQLLDLTVKIIGARHLMGARNKRGLVSPFVELEVIGNLSSKIVFCKGGRAPHCQVFIGLVRLPRHQFQVASYFFQLTLGLYELN